MAEFECPRGHPFPRTLSVSCDECDAMVVCEPVAAGKVYFDLCVDVRLYAGKMTRDREPLVRSLGADILQILGDV